MEKQNPKRILKLTLLLLSSISYVALILFVLTTPTWQDSLEGQAQTAPQRNGDWQTTLGAAVDKAKSIDEIVNTAKQFPQVNVDYAVTNEMKFGIIKDASNGEIIVRFREGNLIDHVIKKAEAVTNTEPRLNASIPPNELVACAVGPNGKCLLFFNDKGQLDGMWTPFDLPTPTCDSSTPTELCNKLKDAVKQTFDDIKIVYPNLPQATSRVAGPYNFISFTYGDLNVGNTSNTVTLGRANYVERVTPKGTSKRCIITIDQNRAAVANDYKLANVIRHEYGHCIGIGHPKEDDINDVMSSVDNPLENQAFIGFNSDVVEVFKKIKQGETVQIDPSKCNLYCGDNEISVYTKEGNVNKYECKCKPGFKKDADGKCIPDTTITGGGGGTNTNGTGDPNNGPGGAPWVCSQVGDKASCTNGSSTEQCTYMGDHNWSCGAAGLVNIQPPLLRTDANTNAGVLLSAGLKSVTTSSTQNLTGQNLSAVNVTDGKPNTRWSSNFSSSNKAVNDNQWITIDLGKTYTINKIVLNWEYAYGKAYKIQFSENNSTWTEAVNITNNPSSGIKSYTTNGKARYVRMLGITRGTPYGYSLFEFEVWGNEITTPPTPNKTITPPRPSMKITSPPGLTFGGTTKITAGKVIIQGTSTNTTAIYYTLTQSGKTIIPKTKANGTSSWNITLPNLTLTPYSLNITAVDATGNSTVGTITIIK